MLQQEEIVKKEYRDGNFRQRDAALSYWLEINRNGAKCARRIVCRAQALCFRRWVLLQHEIVKREIGT